MNVEVHFMAAQIEMYHFISFYILVTFYVLSKNCHKKINPAGPAEIV